MQQALPHRDTVRLESLATFHILDSLPEPVFDDVVRLAARACRMPVAYLGFLDRDREWFKARVGVPVAETPRATAFSNAALASRGLTVIRDAQHDARLADNPLVAAVPHLRFFAGAPLVTTTGQILGTVAVGDVRPRQFRCHQRDALVAAARQVMTQLELRRTVVELTETVTTLTRRSRALPALPEGLLCICAGCKRIREGRRWTSVTDFMEARSAVAFVHGACPECLDAAQPRSV